MQRLSSFSNKPDAETDEYKGGGFTFMVQYTYRNGGVDQLVSVAGREV